MRRHGRIVKGAFWLNLLLLVLFLAGMWVIGLIRFVSDIPNQVEDTTSKTSAIVVLTGVVQHYSFYTDFTIAADGKPHTKELDRHAAGGRAADGHFSAHSIMANQRSKIGAR